jgi:hypothetical protein
MSVEREKNHKKARTVISGYIEISMNFKVNYNTFRIRCIMLSLEIYEPQSEPLLLNYFWSITYG